MKKLVNNPRDVVREMLEGLADLHSGLALLAEENVVLQADLPKAAERPAAPPSPPPTRSWIPSSIP
jgi:hypothetical protein